MFLGGAGLSSGLLLPFHKTGGEFIDKL